LSCCGVAAWVRYPGGFGDFGAVDEFWEAVGPGFIEPVVRAEVHDDALVVTYFFNGINKRLTHAVGKGHYPAVNLAPFFHPSDVVSSQILIGDVSFLVAF